MTPEEQKEFNIKCAEFMDYDVVGNNKEIAMIVIPSMPYGEPEFIEFNPYSDANDRNKVIEKMRISSWVLYNAGNWVWGAFTHDDKYKVKDKSMEAAQIACISKVLESTNKEGG